MPTVNLPALPSKGQIVVASVFVHEGDTVQAGQELFSVETGKSTVPITAPTSGVIMRVAVAAGDTVATRDVLAVIEEQGEETLPHQDQKPASSESEPATAHKKTGAEHAELLVIGGGTGGYVAALYAAKQGMRVTLVERDKLGGTCLNRGCIPTKALISSSSLHRAILHAAEWGLEVDGVVRPNMPAIIERKDRIVDGLLNGVEYLMQANHIRVIRGTACFEGNGIVAVSLDDASLDGGAHKTFASGQDEDAPAHNGNTMRFTYNDCIIATGSTIRTLDLPGADLPEVMNTDEALACEDLPSSIVIVGGGVTGMEFAFLYANLGVDVTVIARRGRVLHVFDEDASREIAHSAVDRGIKIELNGDVKGFELQPDGLVRTTYVTGSETHEVISERVLVAGGRVPTTQGLGLETVGVALDTRNGAVLVDENMRTNVDHLYAIGDVNGLVMLAHAASYQGRIAVSNILKREDSFNKAIVPSVAYTDPEVATVGVSVDESHADAERYKVGTFSFAHNGKALAEGDATGYVALVSDEANLLKGATIVGSHASALIGYIATAISAGLSCEAIQQAVFAHPTTSEAIHEAACDLTFGALHE